jgi:hypothetical protein
LVWGLVDDPNQSLSFSVTRITTHYVIRPSSSAAYQVTHDRAAFQVTHDHTIAAYPVTPDYSNRVLCDAWLGLALSQSVVDHQYRGTFGGSTLL